MTPGILKSMALASGFYMLYLIDRRVAARNEGLGLIAGMTERIVDPGLPPHLLNALMEEARQDLKEHFELTQRPIQRLSYPEYCLVL